jgi:hypothetical protein
MPDPNPVFRYLTLFAGKPVLVMLADLLVPASVAEGQFVIQLDEHQRDGRIAQCPRQVADMTLGVWLRTLVLAQRGIARSHLDPVSVHGLH